LNVQPPAQGSIGNTPATEVDEHTPAHRSTLDSVHQTADSLRTPLEISCWRNFALRRRVGGYNSGRSGRLYSLKSAAASQQPDLQILEEISVAGMFSVARLGCTQEGGPGLRCLSRCADSSCVNGSELFVGAKVAQIQGSRSRDFVRGRYMSVAPRLTSVAKYQPITVRRVEVYLGVAVLLGLPSERNALS
jgi:hypothetical protein